MSLKRVLVSGAAALALVGTAATAAIHVEKDGTGDYLISPVYFANGNGWQTKIKVVNTNTTSAVIAKVIVREGKSSKELVDFPLFLTPGDVFEATIAAGNDGDIYIKSDDDSVIVKADGTPGLNVDLTALRALLNTDCDTDEKKGYIEVIGLGDFNESTLKSWDPTWKVDCPYSKEILFRNVKGLTTADLNLTGAVDVADSDLMGQQIIYRNVSDDNGKRAMFLNMLAFGDTSNEAAMGTGVLGPDTGIDAIYGAPVLVELKNELAKNHVYVMYEGNSDLKADPFMTIFTYPYWKVGADAADCDAYYTLSETDVAFRDMNETAAYCDHSCDDTQDGDYLSGPTPDNPECPEHNMTDEVQIVFLHDEGHPDAWANKYLFKSGGYIDINLPDDTTDYANDLTWKGLPIIPTTFYAKKVGDLYLNNHLYNQYRKDPKPEED
ncbi:hypothetical protein NitYY0826_P25 (plasmid) [Nitratiruptor sp. YY08-26]|uniref:hypothetical protein n=1 Tax=unclassified Nitratiruptor TaxID=2624044 RepID=UPI0018EE0B04|nr:MULTISPECIES: hypothetical protein [unclassified Nitratiruptor]BCD63184.1 hypothetical protein NitYY0813_P25 [Nitratiruptor sp. YY08-13]BCD67120.1 hypothetical protein NitYY0826_P25 [Nitratiruptor sp. YY08-26]